MATEQLLVRLRMDARQYKKQARDASTATGTIAKSSKDATTQSSKLDRQLGNTGFTMRNAVTAGAVAAGAAVVKFAGDSIRAATDLGESINAVRVVFGEAADDVLAIGENSADSFGLANSEFNAFAVRFSAFADDIAEGSGREVGDVVGELTARIADFASVMNIDVPEAAQKFQSGLAGEVEPLRKFGINVSAAATSQRALEMGLADSTSELTEGDKVLARYQLIMEQTADTAGDFKNTQDDLANATRTLNANMEDFKARAGTELTPVMGELASQGLQLFDILDPDVNLGWTQRLSAGIQLVTGEGSKAVESYIEQKEAVNDYEDGVDDLSDSFTENERVSREATAAAGEVRGGYTDAEQAARDFFNTNSDLIDQLGDQGGAWDDVVDSMEDFEDMQRRLTDPVFRLIDDQANLRDAQDRYTEAVEEFGEKSPEAIDAGFDLAEAQASVNSSLQDLPAEAQAAIDHIVILGDEAGITDETLGGMRDTLDTLDGRRVDIEIAIRRTGAPVDPNIIIGAETGFEPGTRHSGGRVEAGKPYVWRPKDEMLITEGGGLVTSRSDTDRIIAAMEGMSNGSSTSTTNFNTNVQSTGDPNTDAQLVGAIDSVRRRMETL